MFSFIKSVWSFWVACFHCFLSHTHISFALRLFPHCCLTGSQYPSYPVNLHPENNRSLQDPLRRCLCFFSDFWVLLDFSFYLQESCHSLLCWDGVCFTWTFLTSSLWPFADECCCLTLLHWCSLDLTIRAYTTKWVSTIGFTQDKTTFNAAYHLYPLRRGYHGQP